jgi:multidrug efflux pump subunit AcrA (membrane-fusion protein)
MRLSAGEGTILVVGDDNRVQVAPILYSVNEGGWVGLISGPPEGTRVVLDGQIGLRAGDRVRFK